VTKSEHQIIRRRRVYALSVPLPGDDPADVAALADYPVAGPSDDLAYLVDEGEDDDKGEPQ
jgi:hypothetical protein